MSRSLPTRNHAKPDIKDFHVREELSGGMYTVFLHQSYTIIGLNLNDTKTNAGLLTYYSFV